jgi:nicotinamide-nucleotide amidase
MKAEIISVGSELTSGQNLDTNSQWLSQRLAEIGISVGWHTTIADDLVDDVAAFRVAAQRAALVLITGGLGPTQDDLTRDALARLAEVELVFHQPSFDHIQQLFAQRHRSMPERNRVQALFPAGAEPIPNAYGTAPGIWMSVGRISNPSHCIVVAMPGVPSEMKAMFD